jgi:RHS repeat-associated protein
VQQSVSGLITNTQYLYDAEGRRVAKGSISSFSCDTTANGFTATAVYVLGPDGEQMTEMAANSSGGWQWAHTNVFAPGLSATYDADLTGQSEGAMYFHLSDWLGARRQQTDYVGNPVLNFTGLPYGDGLATFPVSNTDVSDATEHHFTGKERDTESGNDYFGARYYASSMGRWMSPDPSPAGVNIANPQSWNLYNYVFNNPLRMVDGNGKWATDIHAQIVTYALQNYVSSGELNALRARQYSMDADQSNQNNHAMANQGQSSQGALDAMWHIVSGDMSGLCPESCRKAGRRFS